MSADTSGEHCVPAPERLFPKGLAPGKDPILNHFFVAAPDIVDEDIDGTSFIHHSLECLRNLLIVPMVTSNTHGVGGVEFPFSDRAASHKHAGGIAGKRRC